MFAGECRKSLKRRLHLVEQDVAELQTLQALTRKPIRRIGAARREAPRSADTTLKQNKRSQTLHFKFK